ncbi:YciI family protein [Aquicoccus sp. SCR17]|nr:YciI family protein [Carideicomes alvinocaridis]
MPFAVIARDKPGALEIRKANRDKHLAYLDQTGCVTLAGPLLEEGEMTGSLLILDLPDKAAAEDWAAGDPYAQAGLFDRVEIMEWKKVVG